MKAHSPPHGSSPLMRALQLGTAWPWTLLVVGAALDPCSCDCCVAAESHADPSGATVVRGAPMTPRRIMEARTSKYEFHCSCMRQNCEVP